MKLMPPPNPAKWKRHQVSLLIEQVKKDRAIFVGLQTVDPQVKRVIYPAVRRAINRIHTSRSPQALQYVVLTLAGLVLCLPTIVLALDRMGRLLAGPNVNGWLVATGVFFAYFSIFFLPKAKHNGSAIGWLAMYPVALVVSLVASSPWATHIADDWWFRPIYSLMLGVGIIGIFILTVGLTLTPMLFWIARQLRRQADARILIMIVALMGKTEANPGQWEKLLFRAQLMKELDAIARVIENGIPTAYSDKDILFRGWVSVRCRRIAAHIRDLKGWLAMPRRDTREYFLKELGSVLTCLGLGDWDTIAVADPGSVNNRMGRLATLFSGLRTLLASFLPMGILLLLHVLHRDPPAQMSGFLTFGAAAWLTVGCISLLDPLYASRTEAFKSALQFLPGLKKG